MDSKDIILLLAGAAISLVINYITQFTSVPLANRFGEWRNIQAQKKAKKSVENAKIRIRKVEEEIALLRWYFENPIAFNAFAFDVIINMIRDVIFFGFVGVYAIINSETTMGSVILIFLIGSYARSGKRGL